MERNKKLKIALARYAGVLSRDVYEKCVWILDNTIVNTRDIEDIIDRVEHEVALGAIYCPF